MAQGNIDWKWGHWPPHNGGWTIRPRIEVSLLPPQAWEGPKGQLCIWACEAWEGAGPDLGSGVGCQFPPQRTHLSLGPQARLTVTLSRGFQACSLGWKGVNSPGDRRLPALPAPSDTPWPFRKVTAGR